MATLVLYPSDGPPFAHSLETDPTTIGRHPDNALVLTDLSVSSHHAIIRRSGSGHKVQDLHASNGTRVNDTKAEEVMLNDGDKVSFGDMDTIFLVGDPPAVLPPRPQPAEPPSAAPPMIPPAPAKAVPSLVFYLPDGTSLTQKLDAAVTTVGRHPDSVLVLADPSVSSHHATLKQRADGWYVQDLKSSNGTRVNGADIEESLLKEGDRVSFGDLGAVFYLGEPPVAAPPASVPAPDLPAPEKPPPAPLKAAAQRPLPVRRYSSRTASGYPDTTESGCMTALIVTCLFIASFLIGLSMRHYKETDGGNFFSDLFERVTSGIPKIKIEKTVE